MSSLTRGAAMHVKDGPAQAVRAVNRAKKWPMTRLIESLGKDAGRAVRKYPRPAVAWVTVMALLVYYQRLDWAWIAVAVMLIPALAVAFVSRRWPNMWRQRVAAPRKQRGWVKRVEAEWPRICDENRLKGSYTTNEKFQETYTTKEGEKRTRWTVRDKVVVTSPTLLDVVYKAGILTLTVAPRGGQKVPELINAAETISDTFGGLSHRAVGSKQPTRMTLEILMLDHLSEVRDAVMPKPAGDRPVPWQIQVGWREDGKPWGERITHTFVAGRSQSGKASVMWAYLCTLAPWVHIGHVMLLGLDLKGGMEMKMGGPLFSELATNAADAIKLLQRLVVLMDARAVEMAGVVRVHIASVERPTIILCIDELASLTKYATDAQAKEINRLIPLVLTKGAGEGILVIGCMQDPRKDVVGFRDLFLRWIALALQTATETEMVLHSRVALAHEISDETPGMGYVIGSDRMPVKVRAHYWSDDLLQAVAKRFPPPVRKDVLPAAVPVTKRGAPKRGTEEHNANLERKAAQAAADKAALADLEAQVEFGDFGDEG